MSPSKFNSPVRTGTFKVQKKTEETPTTSTSYRTLYEVIFVKGSHYSINYLVLRLKTQYGCCSTIVFTLKMESVSKITIFGVKLVVRIGLGKIFLKFLHAGNYFFLLHNSLEDFCLKLQIQ